MSLHTVVLPGRRGIPPRVNTFTARFWTALEEGRLESTRCRACAHLGFPPRRICIACGAQDPEWVELSGAGVLYSSTVIHAGPSLYWAGGPYTVGIIDLAEGPRLVTRVLGSLPPPIGSRMQIVVTRHDDGCLFAAIPAAAP